MDEKDQLKAPQQASQDVNRETPRGDRFLVFAPFVAAIGAIIVVQLFVFALIYPVSLSASEQLTALCEENPEVCAGADVTVAVTQAPAVLILSPEVEKKCVWKFSMRRW